jgi:hypothetical protein
MRAVKRALVLQEIVQADLNLSLAARRLEIHRNHIDFLCRGLGIDVEQLRENKKSAKEIEEQRRNTYASTYCRELLPSGVRCNNQITLGQDACGDCRKRLRG